MEINFNEKIKSLQVTIIEKEKIINELNQKIENLNKIINEKDEIIKNFNESVDESKKEFLQMKKKYEDLIIQLENDYNIKNQELDNNFKKNSEIFKKNFYEQLENLKKEYFNTINNLNQKNTNLIKEINELKEYLTSRPSKDEDIDIINQLKDEIKLMEKKMADSDGLIEQFRNELLNREETYNGYFGRRPEVGYVNPLKGKKSMNMTNGMQYKK